MCIKQAIEVRAHLGWIDGQTEAATIQVLRRARARARHAATFKHALHGFLGGSNHDGVVTRDSSRVVEAAGPRVVLMVAPKKSRHG